MPIAEWHLTTKHTELYKTSTLKVRIPLEEEENESTDVIRKGGSGARRIAEQVVYNNPR